MGESDVYTLDEALNVVGFGRFQGFVLGYGALGWISEAMEMMILSFIGSAVQSQWHLSPAQKSLISTVVFAGMLIGASFWGIISDSYGRRTAILGVASISGIAGLLGAFSPNYVSLLILRCIAGVGLGGSHIFNAWFLEFVPMQNRGAWMIGFSSFWTVGTIFEAGLAWIVMPKFGWRYLLGLSSGPSFIVLLLYGLVPESPRFLSMKGRTNEARNVLEQAALLNGTALPTGRLVSDNQGVNNEPAALERSQLLPLDPGIARRNNKRPSALSVLFSPKLIRTNLLLWFLYFGNTFSYYGIVLLTSELSGDQRECSTIVLHSKQSQSGSLYLDVFITSLAEVPGMIIAAFIVDKVGRKVSMIIMLVVSAILFIPLLTPQNEIFTTALLFGARALVSSTFIVACIYAPEVYPTSVRGTAVGVASAVGRVGGMICPLVAVGLVDGCQQTYAVMLFQGMILLSAFSVVLSPFETGGRNLTDNLEE